MSDILQAITNGHERGDKARQAAPGHAGSCTLLVEETRRLAASVTPQRGSSLGQAEHWQSWRH